MTIPGYIDNTSSSPFSHCLDYCPPALGHPYEYELIIGRHRRASFAITSNRAVEEWLALCDDPILGNSALEHILL